MENNENEIEGKDNLSDYKVDNGSFLNYNTIKENIKIDLSNVKKFMINEESSKLETSKIKKKLFYIKWIFGIIFLSEILVHSILLIKRFIFFKSFISQVIHLVLLAIFIAIAIFHIIKHTKITEILILVYFFIMCGADFALFLFKLKVIFYISENLINYLMIKYYVNLIYEMESIENENNQQRDEKEKEKAN